MAKDPAMLWYWNDWYSGTVLFSRFFKGCYMDLLHAQFNHGHLSLDEIKTCLGSDFGQAWPTLQKKFSQDGEGLFFNEKLESEKEKRKAFSESRRANLVKKPHMDHHMEPHMASHMDSHMENENEDVIKEGIRSFKKMTEKEFYDAIALKTSEYPKTVLRDFFEYWKEADGSGKMRFQLGKTWDLNLRLKRWVSSPFNKIGPKEESAIVPKHLKTIG